MNDDVDRIERLLAEERPRLQPLELDELRSRARAQAMTPAKRPQPGGIMRTRLAITAVLVMGIVTSGAGAGLAVSGISGDGSAGIAQYPEENPQGDVLPDLEESPGGGSIPSEDNGNPAQPTEQVSTADDNDLPFTGLAAIPLILVGVGLFGFGIVLRRGARSEPAH